MSAEESLPSSDSRLFIELEFVQNLANPKYLNYLAQQGFLDQIEFINFLKYLRYWKQPNYLKHLAFPQCLVFLDALIENSRFKRELTVGPFIEYVHQQQGFLWMEKSDK